MADVVGSLPAALRALDVECTVLTPYYPQIHREKVGPKIGEFPVVVGDTAHPVRLLEGDAHTVLVDAPVAYDRPGVYDDPRSGEGFSDSLYRCVILQQAARIAVRDGLIATDVVHCHDNHTGLVPVYLRDDGGPPSILTIHNLAFQGIYGGDDFWLTGLSPDRFSGHSAFEYFGDLNLLKAGILHADFVTTVSPNYAAEIVQPGQGHGLDGVLRLLGGRLVGILNGMDVDAWNPKTDTNLPANYSRARRAGKEECRAALRARAHLDDDNRAPVCGIVSRVTHQKGLDLVGSMLPWIVRRGAQVVLLGSGDQGILDLFRGAQGRWPGRVALLEGYDEALSHLVYAGSDIYLMPSRFEPCGLSQMYALRYGTVPVVTRTGGLADTVEPISDNGSAGVGVLAHWATVESFQGALEYALDLFRTPEKWRRIQRNGMRCDFSWEKSAQQYAELYEQARRG
jgi:starch synthase